VHTKFDEEANLIDHKFATQLERFSEEFIWLFKALCQAQEIVKQNN
jgi:hypothetical protein